MINAFAQLTGLLECWQVQIFCCIVAKIPVMRQPLQILFLILVTVSSP